MTVLAVSKTMKISLREVDQGDKLIVNFYNMEAPSGEMHSFTIDAPYNVNIDIDIRPRHNGTGIFIADHPGTFKFYFFYCHGRRVNSLTK